MAKGGDLLPVPKTPEELHAEAVINWERARDHAAMVRAEWDREGGPLTTLGHNNIEYEHPLHKMLREVEKEAAARLKDIPRDAKQPGRKQVGQIASSITESPASARRRLRSVEGGKK